MDSKERLPIKYFIVLVPLGILTAVWAVSRIPTGKISLGLIMLSFITVFLSSYLRIQLPRTKTYLSISDAMIMLSMLIYGGEVAVLLSILETAFNSFSLHRKGIKIQLKTAIANIAIGAISVFITTVIVRALFGPMVEVFENGEISTSVRLLAVMTVSLFLSNSIGISAVIAARSKKPFADVWIDLCVSALVMYVSSAVLAGFAAKALQQVDVFVLAVAAGIFALFYFGYRRYIEDIMQSADRAERAERDRAEQAEDHVKQLKHYIEKLEGSSDALQKSHEDFRQAAYYDSLTGLPNRSYFIDTIKELLHSCQNGNHTNFAVLFIDLKNFKTINDSLGHSMGDRLLRNVAKRISGTVRLGDVVGRFGGDKFGIVLKNLQSNEEATGFSARLALRIAQPYALGGRQVFTSAKIGIAFGDSKYSEAEDILRDADIAMYYTKGNEEDYVVFDQTMHARAVTRLRLETDLRFAVERNEFELFYQPIIGLDGASLEGFEALVRWNHPQLGLIDPNDFIPLSEDTGLIIPMTVQILHSACKQVVKWQEDLNDGKPLSIAVNLSGKHFVHPALVEQIRTVIAETGITPACLKLELTESALMENAETATMMLKHIKETGVQISVDDFGTGYSSLSYLHRFPIDTLKVDRSFVSTMEDGSENGEIVRTVIALAKALNLTVVAEGIETIHQFHQLRILGCEFGQGFLFSRPLPVSEISKLLTDRNQWRNILPENEFGVVARNLEFTQLRLQQTGGQAGEHRPDLLDIR